MRISRAETQKKLDRLIEPWSRLAPTAAFTLADRFEAQAQNRADHPFVVFGDSVITYAEMNRRANRIAHAAQSLGLRRGNACALVMDNRPDYFAIWFGLSKLGVIPAMVNNQIKGEPLRNALRETGAEIAIVGTECMTHFESVPFRIWQWNDPEHPREATSEVIDLTAHAATQPSENPPASLREGLIASDTALYYFTSGTTGHPKAAIVSHHRWLTVGAVLNVALDTKPEDVFYCFLPLFHGAAGMSLTSTALSSGATIALRRKFSTRAFWPDVRRHGITICQYIGEICRYLLSQPPQPNDRDHTLRKLTGAGLSHDTWVQFQERFGIGQIFEGWGATESNTGISNWDNEPGAVGRITSWDKTGVRLARYDIETETHLRDANGFLVLCGPHEVGEALGRISTGPGKPGNRFEGYTSSAATEAKILRNVFEPGDAYWASGDLLKFDDDGYVSFVDRVGDTFRWKSENVSTLEVAEVLYKFPGIETINVYGVKSPGHEGRCGMAAVVMKPGETFDPSAFYRFVSAQLPSYAAPQFVRVCATADITASFKLRKVDLQRQGYDPQRCRDPLFVRDEAGATYSPISPEVLDRAGFPPFEP